MKKFLILLLLLFQFGCYSVHYPKMKIVSATRNNDLHTYKYTYKVMSISDNNKSYESFYFYSNERYEVGGCLMFTQPEIYPGYK